jgi:trk system potassium uptake protein TrkH
MGMKSSAMMAEMVDAASIAHLGRTVMMIIGYTLFIEALGAGVLYLQLDQYPPEAFHTSSETGLAGSESAKWAAVFHAVSAFCNGSLSNFRGGLVPFAQSPFFCQSVAILILLGGMGFPVIHELLFRGIDRLRHRRPARLTLNTRVALAAGAILLAGVALSTLVMENGASFKSIGLLDRLNAAFFHSACARTSGFNLVDVSTMRPATLLLTCLAMFIGGSSGSTAGGIKTTTFAVLFAAFRGELRGDAPTLFERTLPDAVVRRAMGVAFLSTMIVIAVVFALLLTERQAPLALLFETVSAFSTTGMSTGITPHLSIAGKIILAATMLMGRIGPLTVALALSGRARRSSHALPQERVMIG